MPGCGKRVILTMLAVAVVLAIVISIAALLYEQNPPVVAEPNWNSPQTKALAQRACYDCHSNETRWPWFDRLPPASWLAVFDTIRGRRELNWSEWNTRMARRNNESGEQINRGEMPPGAYLLLHPEARLSDAEKQQLIQGLRATR